MSPSRTSPHVLIVGGGIGGLVLGQVLRKHGVSFEIFERSESRHARPEGWAIAIHGVLAELYEAMPDDMPPTNELNHLHPLDLAFEFAFYSPETSMEKVGYRDDGAELIMRANRHRFRDWLLHNLPVTTGKQAVQVEENEDSVKVHFQDGTSATGDILVGADGVRSIVRKHMLKGKDIVEHDNIAMITSNLRLEGAEMAEQLDLGHSAYMVVIKGPPNDTYYRYFVGLDKVAPDGKSGDYYFHLAWEDANAGRDDHWMASATAEELRNYALRATKGAPRQFRCMVERAKLEDVKVPPLRLVTILLDTLPVGRVTILGDAAHAMTPFLAQGAVHAIRDALSLGKALSAVPDASRSAAIKHLEPYQEEMLTRGRQAAANSKLAFAETTVPKMMFGRPVVTLPVDDLVL
ncbi:monooxygenase [Apiospora arundinis]